MSPNSSNFLSYIPCPYNKMVQTTNGTPLTAVEIGKIKLEPIDNLENYCIFLNDVLVLYQFKGCPKFKISLSLFMAQRSSYSKPQL